MKEHSIFRKLGWEGGREGGWEGGKKEIKHICRQNKGNVIQEMTLQWLVTPGYN